jgi:TonB family protein
MIDWKQFRCRNKMVSTVCWTLRPPKSSKVDGPLCDLKAEAILTNFGPLLQLSEERQSAPAVSYRNINDNGAELLELRTEAGTVYVRPSRWQRIRLQWAFRHFRVLPPQLLSRGDRRLIEKLSRSAVVKPTLPVARNTVFGVVDQGRPKSPASANRLVTLRTARVTTQVFLARSATPALPTPDLHVAVKQKEAKEAPGGLKDWGIMLVAVCITVILASFSGIPLFSSAGEMGNPQTMAKPIEAAANQIKPSDLHPAATSPLLLVPTTASLPNVEKTRRWVAAPPPEATVAQQQAAPLAGGSDQSINASRFPPPALATVPDTIPQSNAPSATVKRRFVSELPQGHFAHPVVSEPNLVGELQLRALIAADGSVKEVSVLSGNAKLGEAAMRAVRQWHYSPNQLAGSPADVETQIKMNFFGQDAISIASVADKGQAPARTEETSPAP